MENRLDENEKAQQISDKKGGFRTLPFIIANESFEKVASFGLMANMILYLTRDYYLEVVSAASILFIWSALSNFIPIVGAFLSDSYLGRFRTIATGSIASFLGMILLWMSSEFPQARPPICNLPHSSCKLPTASQLTLLIFSFGLFSIGAGCIRPCSLAFGADQLHQNNSKSERIMQSFFNLYYVSIGVSVMISSTVIVYIQENKGWSWGFGVPVILMLFSALFFFLGSSFYVKREANTSMFTGLAMVIVAAARNRNLALPPNNGWYHHNGSKIASPTNKLRFLNKACIIKSHEDNLSSEGSPSKVWNLCTVEQVEGLKAIIKLIPIWSTGIMIAITISQRSFQVLQANTMNRHLGRDFQIPAGSFAVFTVLTLSAWVGVYDRLIIPAVSKVCNKQWGLTLKQRMGIGLLLSSAAMAVSAIVERGRRKMAIRQGLLENAHGLVSMSAMWLVPQHCLTGLAEAFNGIGQIEFYYTELPKNMTSLAVALFTLGMAVGNLMGSLLVGTVDRITKRGGRTGWVSNNLNKGHYDYYYWLLSILSLINFGFFLVCSWVYGSVEKETRVEEEKQDQEVIDGAKTLELEISEF